MEYNWTGFWIMTIAFILIFYFILIKPQKKKEKETKQMRDSIQIGDEITTIGGIVGIVVKKSQDTLVIETGGDRSKIRIKTWAVQENATVHDMMESAAASKKSKKEEKSSKNDIEKSGEVD
ncbi:MAG: preprotein translocase subunit YajC [Oscillospiraceae bacterium]|nr:preprotein translocase subunit YajC [Oscillospiraceae bacterium]